MKDYDKQGDNTMWYIYKYLLPGFGEESSVELPSNMHICDVNHQDGKLYMWACVDTSSPIKMRKIMVIGTGWEIENPGQLQFLRTVHMPNGCICHVIAVHDDPSPDGPQNTLNVPDNDHVLELNTETGNAKDVA